jgi:hypothetical protein
MNSVREKHTFVCNVIVGQEKLITTVEAENSWSAADVSVWRWNRCSAPTR